MNLAKTYCKEIINGLDKIPVYLPGTPINVGDIITFGKGFIKPRPIGSFDPISKLSSLGVDYKVQDDEGASDSYFYTSNGAVGSNFTANVNTATPGEGKLEINFNKEGTIYFAAIDCKVNSIVDTSSLKKQLEPHRDSIDWKNCFIVTSVTIAKRALIMQSNSQTASLTIEGNVNGLQANGSLDIGADIALKISSYKNSSFIKDWSENVTVFFSLARYRKKFLGDWGIATKRAMYTNEIADSYELTPVYPDDLLMDE